jgi:hypothetical protein
MAQIHLAILIVHLNLFSVPLHLKPHTRPAIPNSERVYVVSGDQVPSVELDLNDKSRVSGSENFEFGIADTRRSPYAWSFSSVFSLGLPGALLRNHFAICDPTIEQSVLNV